MNLVASLIVKNELDRYLLACVENLLGFCDEIRVFDDGSTDGTTEVLREMSRVKVKRVDESRFYAHEGQARQAALDWTLHGNPTHVLAIDADEIIENGQELRTVLETGIDGAGGRLWTLCMEEVWGADEHELAIRQDGGWRAHPVGIVWSPERGRRYAMPDRALASGRVPIEVARIRSLIYTGVSILHFGWARDAERVARHARYVEHDGGRFHAGAHLDSILWPADRVKLDRCPWHESVPKLLRQQILDTVNRP